MSDLSLNVTPAGCQLRSIEEAACIFAVCPRTIRNLISQGKLASVRMGRRVLISDAALERFVKSAERREKP